LTDYIIMNRFVLSIVILTFLFSACTVDGDNKIVIWTSLRPVERDLLQTKLDSFSQNYPEYKFIQLFYAPEELRTNFIIAALAGKGPALIHCASDFIGPLSELEVIRPLEDLYQSEFLAQFITKPFDANTTFAGHLYQIADRVGNHLCLVYNKDIIAQPPSTVAELIEKGQALVRDTDGDGDSDRSHTASGCHGNRGHAGI